MAGNPCNIIPDQEIVLEGGAKLVPAPGAADAGKVLGVINQEGGIGWVEDQSGTLVQQQANWTETNDQSVSFIQNKPTIPTVDQTYDAASSNAQSGAAVAQAIAAIPSSSYTAGDGIEINNNKIAVRAGKNLDFANTLIATQLYSPSREYPPGSGSYAYSFIGQMTMARLIQLRHGMTIKMKASLVVNMTGSTGGAHFAICRKNSDNSPNLSGSVVLVADAALSTATSGYFMLRAGNTYVVDFSSLSAKSVGSFIDIDPDNVDKFYLTLISYGSGDPVSSAWYSNALAYLTYDSSDVNTAEYYTENPSVKELVAVDQLPASTSEDATKVLTVDSSGVPGWAPAASGAVPVLHTITCQENSVGVISGLLPNGEYLEPGLYQVFLTFSMSEYNSAYRHMTFGYIVDDGSDTIYGRIYYPVSIDSNGPFGNVKPLFMRTGYIQVGYPGEVNGIVVRFTNGTTSITGSSILNNLSLQYLKVADLS